MANEAVLIQQLQDRLPQCKVADGATILKGTILKLSDANTGAASSADGDVFLGIAAVDKLANDGQTTIAYWDKGIFDLKDSGAGITAGNPVKINGANLIATADDATAAGLKEVVGYALQTAAASEVIEVKLR